MKVVGIIAEYNPFHKGHKYHIKKEKKIKKEKVKKEYINNSNIE